MDTSGCARASDPMSSCGESPGAGLPTHCRQHASSHDRFRLRYGLYHYPLRHLKVDGARPSSQTRGKASASQPCKRSLVRLCTRPQHHGLLHHGSQHHRS